MWGLRDRRCEGRSVGGIHEEKGVCGGNLEEVGVRGANGEE